MGEIVSVINNGVFMIYEGIGIKIIVITFNSNDILCIRSENPRWRVIWVLF